MGGLLRKLQTAHGDPFINGERIAQLAPKAGASLELCISIPKAAADEVIVATRLSVQCILCQLVVTEAFHDRSKLALPAAMERPVSAVTLPASPSDQPEQPAAPEPARSPDKPFLPTAQVAPLLEQELRALLLTQQAAQAARKPGKSDGTTWAEFVLRLTAAASSKLAANDEMVLPGPARAGVWHRLKLLLGTQQLSQRIDPAHPSVCASVVLSLLRGDDALGTHPSIAQLQEALVTFLQKLSAGAAVGKDGCAMTPSKEMQQLADELLDHYQFAGVREQETVGVVNKFLSLAQIQERMGATHPVVAAAAFRQFEERMMQFATRLAPSGQEDAAVRTAYDKQFSDVLRTAASSSSYQAMTLRQKQAFELNARTAADRVNQRNLVKVNTAELFSGGKKQKA